MAGFYDLIDVTYFRNDKSSPRRVVFEEIKDKDKILDMCTGTATNAIRIAQKNPYAKVVGIDLSKDMLRVAREKIKRKRMSNIRLYCMDATRLPFKEKYFDKVLLSLVLHEIDEDLAARILMEAKRVLKEDGELIITEWERSTELFKKVLFFPIELMEPQHYKCFMKKDLHGYFASFGLKVVQERHCDYSRVLILQKV